MKPFLKKIISASGLSGYESEVRDQIAAAWQPLTDKLTVSRMGSLHGLRQGSLPAPRPGLLLAAHMDAIGLMVKGMVDGLLRVTNVGGIDPRVLPGQTVTVHGREKLPGVVILPPAHLLPEKARNEAPRMEHLLIDTGLRVEEVATLVRIGDLVSFAQPPMEMEGELLLGHSLDNRASVAALTYCLESLQSRNLDWDVWAAATVQEEVTLGGAATSAFEIKPTLAVAIDVTFADGPGSPAHQTYPLGKGITLGWGANIHPGLYRSFKEIANNLEIPYEMEVMPRSSGTDAMALQVAAEGIPSMVIGIPLRYMHTPVEVVALKDVHRAGRLIAEFTASLTADFIDRLAWDEDE